MNQTTENNYPNYQSPFKDIFEAAKKGTVKDLQYFVETKGIEVKVSKDDGRTLLHLAASNNPNIEVIEYLISQGIDVNALDYFNEIPLHCGARNFNIEIVKYLISQDAKVNDECEQGKTPLHIAVGYSNTEAVKYLISQGADVNAWRFDFQGGCGTPLNYAKTEEIKSILREAGAK